MSIFEIINKRMDKYRYRFQQDILNGRLDNNRSKHRPNLLVQTPKNALVTVFPKKYLLYRARYCFQRRSFDGPPAYTSGCCSSSRTRAYRLRRVQETEENTTHNISFDKSWIAAYIAGVQRVHTMVVGTHMALYDIGI